MGSPRPVSADEPLYCGLDVGTAFIVLAVVDAAREPVACAYRFASVVKDGMVVDYMGAVDIARELKEELEQQLGRELEPCAVALPPGTEGLDGGVVKNVAEGAGLDVVAVFDEAELYKRDPAHHREIFPVVKPTIDKVASIIARAIDGYDVPEIVLVGGTAELTGIEAPVEKALGIPVHKPNHPMFVTPLGIALGCQAAAEGDFAPALGQSLERGLPAGGRGPCAGKAHRHGCCE